MGTEARHRPGWPIDDYQSLAARLNQVSDELASLRVCAHSADGSVKVTVGPTGELDNVTFDLGAAAGVELATLARRVVEAARLAADAARGRRLAAVSAMLPPHLRDVVAEAGSEVR
jgi:DNA-binding protein YbaB